VWGRFEFADPDYDRKRSDFSDNSAYGVINSNFPPGFTLEKKVISAVIGSVYAEWRFGGGTWTDGPWSHVTVATTRDAMVGCLEV
jgi:hypothetical protein